MRAAHPKNTNQTPYAYSVEAGVVSRIAEINPVFSQYPILSRHVFTASQLAKMEVTQ